MITSASGTVNQDSAPTLWALLNLEFPEHIKPKVIDYHRSRMSEEELRAEDVILRDLLVKRFADRCRKGHVDPLGLLYEYRTRLDEEVKKIRERLEEMFYDPDADENLEQQVREEAEKNLEQRIKEYENLLTSEFLDNFSVVDFKLLEVFSKSLVF